MNQLASRPAMRFDPAIRDQIENLSAEYVYALDDGEMDRWPQFFTEQGVYHITTRENYDAGLPIGILRCVGRGMMADRVKAFHTANIFEPHSYNHIVSRPLIELGTSPGDYSARSNFQVVRIMQDGRSELFATGSYRDIVALEGGVATYKERIVVLDSRQIDILLVVPI